MAERDTFVETISDGDQLNQGYFNGIFDKIVKSLIQDQTAATIASSTSETEIGEVEIPADEVDSGVLVIATGSFDGNQGATSTIKLYGGTNATATNNTLFKTITRKTPTPSSSDTKVGWTIVYWVTGLTWASLNYINITGENSASNAGIITGCESIVCLTI